MPRHMQRHTWNTYLLCEGLAPLVTEELSILRRVGEIWVVALVLDETWGNSVVEFCSITTAKRHRVNKNAVV